MGEPKLNDCLKALADSTRRDIIDRLCSSESTVLSENEREAKTELVHNHLPRLAGHGFIEYEEMIDSVEIRRGPNWELLEDLHTCVEESEIAN